MFYFEEINGYKVLKSDLGVNVGLNHYFTTRGLAPSLPYLSQNDTQSFCSAECHTPMFY